MNSAETSKMRLESKKYQILVEGTMPTLEFEINSGGTGVDDSKKITQNLTLELYNPLAGEIFEAKFPKGRIEVDNDGSMTYFSSSSESVNVSIFLGHNLILSFNRKTGIVSIRTPSKIVSIEQDIQSEKAKKGEAVYDSVKLKLQ